MDYKVYIIETSDEWKDILTAFLGELPFDMFQDHKKGIEAYIPQHLHTADVEQSVKAIQENYPFEYQVKDIESENWNQVWESNFDTVQVGDFCGIRADFHPPFENVTHEIVINPKMAFGTGHHATTYMMIDFMKEIDFKGKSVLDYGSGTGILAILAAQMGCIDIDAVEIEDAAFLNMQENIERNQTPHVRCIHGTLDDVPKKKYDIILANINRNVILQSFPELSQRIPAGGILLSSGYLLEDQEQMTQTHQEQHFWVENIKNKGKWIATQAFKRYVE